MSGTPWHSIVFPPQTEEELDKETGPSSNGVQPVHTGPGNGTERPGGGKPLAHLVAHLYVQPNTEVDAVSDDLEHTLHTLHLLPL